MKNSQEKQIHEFINQLDTILDNCRIDIKSITYIEVKELKNKLIRDLKRK